MTDPAPAAPTGGRARLLFLSAAALLVLASLALFASAPQPERVAAAGADATAIPVRALEIRPRPIARSTRLSGVVEARRRVELFAETSGRVVELGAEELDLVTEDQLLAQVDPLLAEVAVERGLAAVARAESQLGLAASERKRFESLAGRDAASASRRDQAVSGHTVAAANLREARANLAEARDQLAKKTIRAPFAGVLQSFPVEKGELLRVGEKLAELLDLTEARIDLGVTDREIVELRAGAPAAVSLEAYPGEAFEGRILRVGAAADRVSRKFPVEIAVDNTAGRILPGMVARVTLGLGEPEPMRAIPRDAALDQFGVRFVYVIEPGDEGLVVRRRRVAVRDIPFRPEEIELVSGLEDGERIATSGIRELRDGAAVRVHNAGAVAGTPPGADES